MDPVEREGAPPNVLSWKGTHLRAGHLGSHLKSFKVKMF